MGQYHSGEQNRIFTIEPHIYNNKVKMWFEWKIVKNVVTNFTHKKD
jgi:hypothetical protein